MVTASGIRVIGALNDKLRVKMIWISLTILTILATVEAGLAFMREILMTSFSATIFKPSLLQVRYKLSNLS